MLDTNVYISHLINTSAQSPPARLVVAGLGSHFTLMCSSRLLAEIRGSVVSKPYLRTRITDSTLDDLAERLVTHGELVMDDDDRSPTVTRDPKDDFLVVLAVRADADYLVSGDPDLLVLGSYEGVTMVNPARMVEILGLR